MTKLITKGIGGKNLLNLLMENPVLRLSRIF